jgi:hypothetical protein
MLQKQGTVRTQFRRYRSQRHFVERPSAERIHSSQRANRIPAASSKSSSWGDSFLKGKSKKSVHPTFSPEKNGCLEDQVFSAQRNPGILTGKAVFSLVLIDLQIVTKFQWSHQRNQGMKTIRPSASNRQEKINFGWRKKFHHYFVRRI